MINIELKELANQYPIITVIGPRKSGKHLIPIKVKSSKTFHSDFLKRIQYFQKISEGRAPKGYLIYTGDQEQQIHNIELLNFKHCLQSLKPSVD